MALGFLLSSFVLSVFSCISVEKAKKRQNECHSKPVRLKKESRKQRCPQPVTIESSQCKRLMKGKALEEHACLSKEKR